jgi:hypothetical protein
VENFTREIGHIFLGVVFPVMAGKNKEVLINIRLKPETREEFRIAAELRGATMSGLLHQFIVRTIREEKERDPEAFSNLEDPSSNDEMVDQHIDPQAFPQRNKLYKRFLRAQEKNSNMNDTSDPTLINEDVVDGIRRQD